MRDCMRDCQYLVVLTKEDTLDVRLLRPREGECFRETSFWLSDNHAMEALAKSEENLKKSGRGDAADVGTTWEQPKQTVRSPCDLVEKFGIDCRITLTPPDVPSCFLRCVPAVTMSNSWAKGAPNTVRIAEQQQ